MADTAGQDITGQLKTMALPTDLEVTYYVYRPTGSPRAGILLLHGFGEHAGRYNEICNHLTAQGFAIFAPDQRGHGRTGGRRGHVDRFDQYIEDAEAFIGQIRHEERDIKHWFVLGHSMGGLVALRFCMRQSRNYDGLIVSNPLLGLAVKVPKLKAWAGKLTSSLIPTLTMANEVDPAALSRDPAVGRAYVADPKVHRVVTSRWFVELLKAMKHTHEHGPQQLTLPILWLMGTGDRVVDPNAGRGLYDALRCTRHLEVYPGWFHEIFNDPERLKVFKDISIWLDAQLGTSSNSP